MASRETAYRVRSVLNQVLYLQDGKEGGHWEAKSEIADGNLLVLGSVVVQAGVAELVDDVVKHPVPPSRTVELKYWLVVGRPQAKAEIPADIDPEIRPALQEIAKRSRPQGFSSIERVSIASNTGQEGRAIAPNVEVRQTAWDNVDHVDANIEIKLMDKDHRNQLQTRVDLAQDQTLVLGATGYEQPSEKSGGATLYCLVQASTRASAASH
jgi:hypothetical protein